MPRRPAPPSSLSPHVRAILTTAHEVYGRSHGKFDVTCRPLTSLWRACEARGREPDEKELKETVALCGWRQFRLREGRLEKLADRAAIDLGGIKGYAVDRAVEAMRGPGVRGGLVPCGGDLRVFGETEHGRPWTITIGDPRSPQSTRPAATIEVTDAAVSTSGDSRRFFVIGQRHYSHILDPDTGWPVAAPIQVTVVAPQAVQSDAWSKPLCILGEKAFALLPSGVAGMVLSDAEGSLHVVKTEGFPCAVHGATTVALALIAFRLRRLSALDCATRFAPWSGKTSRKCFSMQGLSAGGILRPGPHGVGPKSKAATILLPVPCAVPARYRWGGLARTCPKSIFSRVFCSFYTTNSGIHFRHRTGSTLYHTEQTEEKTVVSPPCGVAS